MVTPSSDDGRIVNPSWDEDQLDGTKLRFVDVKGVRTRYYEDGRGEPLVLVHGGEYGFVAGLDDWSLNLSDLAKSFHVLALDRLGQGHTDIPMRLEDYSFEALFRHFLDFLAAVDVSNAHFVGHSRGGFLVTYLAMEFPEMVRSLVIVDSNTAAPDNPDYPADAFYDDLARRMRPAPNSRQSLRYACAANSYSDAHITDDYLSRLVEIAQLPSTQVAQDQMSVIEGMPSGGSIWVPSLSRKRKETLQRVDLMGLPVPTLLIWGANDPSAGFLPYAIPLFQRISARTACAELHVLNRAGHYSYREQPLAFNRTVQAFCLR